MKMGAVKKVFWDFSFKSMDIRKKSKKWYDKVINGETLII